jgi:hypothetical protein
MRLLQMSINVIVFAVGCRAAALLYARPSVWCFCRAAGGRGGAAGPAAWRISKSGCVIPDA